LGLSAISIKADLSIDVPVYCVVAAPTSGWANVAGVPLTPENGPEMELPGLYRRG
jgi:hypothetical protein